MKSIVFKNFNPKGLIILIILLINISSNISREVSKTNSKSKSNSKEKILLKNEASTKSKILAKLKNKANSSNKSKDYGSGNMSEGFECPFIELYDSEGNKLSTTSHWAFKPSKFSSTSGFVLTITENDTLFDKFLQVKPHSKRVNIPWRYFADNQIRYEKKTMSYKMIVAKLQNDSGDKVIARFNLPWKMIGDYITEKDVTDIIGNIIEYRNKEVTEIRSSKANVNAYFMSMLASHNALQSQKQDAKKFKETVEKRMRENQAILNGKRIAREHYEKVMQKYKNQIKLLTSNFNNVNLKVTQMQEEIENNTELMNDMARKALFEKLENQIKDIKDNIKTYVDAIRSFIRNRPIRDLMNISLSGNVEKLNTYLERVKPNSDD